MSKLSKFIGEAKEYEIEGLGKIKIYPLKVKDISLFKEGMNKEEQINASKQIIIHSLRDEEGITEEEVESLPLQIFTILMDAINEVNGFTDKGHKSQIERIKQLNSKNLQGNGGGQ